MARTVRALKHSASHLSAIGSILLLTTFCAAQGSSDWPQFLNDNMSRTNPNETVLNTSNVGSLQLLWKYHTGVPVESSPAVARGLVYIGSGRRNLLALNSRTGAKVWAFQADSNVNAPPAVVDGVVSFGSDAATLYGVDAVTGAPLWGQRWWAIPIAEAVADGQIYAVSDTFGNIIENADPSSGNIEWGYNLHSYIGNLPSAGGGQVYVTSTRAAVDAFNASTGASLWTSSSIVYIEATAPAIANGKIYVASGPTLYTFDPTTGALIWSHNTGQIISPALAVDDTSVYMASQDNSLYVADANTGNQIWTYATGGQLWGAPAVANGVVYVGSRDSKIYALDTATGAPLWSYATGGQVNSSPTVAGGVLYVGSDDGYVYAFSLPGPGLHLSTDVSTESPAQGSVLTYTFNLWNKSSGKAIHEVLRTQVPAGTTFSSIALSGTPGVGSCTVPAIGGSGPVTCNENSVMGPGSTWTVRMKVRVNAPSATVLHEVANASSYNLPSATTTTSATVR